jgi:hypothetical protein
MKHLYDAPRSLIRGQPNEFDGTSFEGAAVYGALRARPEDQAFAIPIGSGSAHKQIKRVFACNDNCQQAGMLLRHFGEAPIANGALKAQKRFGHGTLENTRIVDFLGDWMIAK